MSIVGEDHRRHPRLSVACRVELRDRYVTWSCETADIGPRGCQVVTSRAPVLGALLGLGIASERMESPLEVAGQVTWVQKGASARAGISFLGSIVGASASPTDWFVKLLGAEFAEAAGRGEVSPLLADMMVYLGAPPSSEVRVPEEREVLAHVGGGVRLPELMASCPKQTVEALLRRGWITLVRASAVSPEKWSAVLAAGFNRAAARQRAADAAFLQEAIVHGVEIDVQAASESASDETSTGAATAR